MPYVCYHILYEFLYYPRLVFSMLLGKKGGVGGQHFTTKIYVYIFLPLPKVTLSRRKIQTKNKQSCGTVQSYQIEHEIYLIFMLQNVSFDCRKSNQCVHKAVFNNILSVVQLCIIKI